MDLKNYIPVDTNLWTGRVDDLEDVNSFRMHQVIKLLDLKELKALNVDTSKQTICLLGYCSDVGIKRNLGRLGAKHGPEVIRSEFASLPVSFNNNALVYDAGNLFCIEDDLERIQKQLEIVIEQMLNKNLFPIVLGGSHDVAYGHYNGIVKYLNKQSEGNFNLGIINIDAHFDLRPYNKEGSSGTMFSQIADDCFKEDRAFNYMCLGIQKSGNTKALFNRADSLGVDYVFADEFYETNHINISERIKRFIDDNDYIYLTLCSDVLDSASAPGVSAMQPLGLNPRHVLKFIQEILNSKKVISFDIAEVSPPLDHGKRTSKLAAILIHRIIDALCE